MLSRLKKITSEVNVDIIYGYDTFVRLFVCAFISKHKLHTIQQMWQLFHSNTKIFVERV